MNQNNDIENKILPFKERIKITLRKLNGLCALLMFIAIVAEFILYSMDKTIIGYGTLRLVILFALQMFCFFYADKISYYIISFITVFGFFITFFIYPLIPIYTINEENMLLVLIISIPIIVLPNLLYHIIKDRYWIFSWLAIFLFIIIYDLNVLNDILLKNNMYNIPMVFRYNPMIKIAHMGAILFFFFVVYNYKLSNHKHRNEIIKNNNLLKDNIQISIEQSLQLVEQKEALNTAEEEFNYLNKKLEKKVILRAHKLKKQKEDIIKYAFMNSHILKAPIARLKGLVNLSKLIETKDEQNNLLKLVEEEVENLDKASQSINAVMQKQDKDKLNEIQKRVFQIYGGE